jgi:hypothetical protein
MNNEKLNKLIADSKQASSVQVFFCGDPECRRPHVVLFDEDKIPFAQFVMPDPRPNGGSFFNDLEDAIYRSMQNRGEL